MAQTISAEKSPDIERARMDLKARGCYLLKGCISESVLAWVRDEFSEELARYAEKVDPNRGAKRYGMFLPFREPFTLPDIVANPAALAIIRSLLGEDIVCSYFSSDTPLPGSSFQHAHSDVRPLFPESQVTLPPFAYVVDIPLVDFTEDNGPLEIWPYGTHLVSDPDVVPVADFSNIERELSSPKQRLADEMGGVPLLAPAGSILIRDLRMWHRGTPNRSTEPRPMIALVYNRPWYHHAVVQIGGEEYGALAPEVQHLFRQAVRAE